MSGKRDDSQICEIDCGTKLVCVIVTKIRSKAFTDGNQE